MSQRLDIEIVGDDISFKLPTRCEQKNGGIWPLPKTVYTWNPHSFSRWCSQTPTSRCFHTSSIQLYSCNNLWLGSNWKLKSSHGSTGLKQLLLTHHSGLSEVWPLMILCSRILPIPGQLCQVFSLTVWPIFSQSFKYPWWHLVGKIISKWWTRPEKTAGIRIGSKIYFGGFQK